MDALSEHSAPKHKSYLSAASLALQQHVTRTPVSLLAPPPGQRPKGKQQTARGPSGQEGKRGSAGTTKRNERHGHPTCGGLARSNKPLGKVMPDASIALGMHRSGC